MFQAIRSRGYKEGLDDEDLLREQIAPHGDRRAQLLRRCPDLGRLLAHLR